jgi:hypothetical protein
MVNSLLPFRNQEFNEPGIVPPPQTVILTTLTVNGALSAGSVASAGAVTAASVAATGLVSAGDLQAPTAEISGLTVGSLSSTGSVATTGALAAGSLTVGSVTPLTVTSAGVLVAHDLQAPTAEISGLTTTGTLSTGAVAGSTATFSGAVQVASVNNGGAGAWQLLAYLNGWSTRAGFFDLAYKILPDQTVQLRGTCVPGGANTIAAQLPVAVRPASNISFPCSHDNVTAGQMVRITIDIAGNITSFGMAGAGTTFSFDQCKWSLI